MVDYEKGTASWDIGQIMTRHHEDCVRRHSLRSTAQRSYSSAERLDMALNSKCTCEAGDSDTETTSLRPLIGPKEDWDE